MSPAAFRLHGILGLVVLCAALLAPGALARSGGEPSRRAHQVLVDPGPRLKIRSPGKGATVSGRIPWRVALRGPKPQRVDLAVDGAVTVRLHSRRAGHARLTHRRAVATLDTRRLSNGIHTLTATAYGHHSRRVQRARVRVKVLNPPKPSPSPSPTPSPGPAPAPSPAPAPNSIYWGAWIGSHLTGSEAPWDMSAVSKFEAIAGKHVSIVQFGSPFANCQSSPCSYYSFPWTPFNDIRAHGSIPFLSWSSQSLPSSKNQPDFQLSDVISGAHDGYIRAFALKAREWGNPFFLRFNWEMNGDWFSWSEGVNGNKAGEYVAAWRHVHDIFTSVGATNVSWVWCPNIDPDGAWQNLAPLYPGDAYVDWTCLDGYNWGANQAGVDPTSARVWRSFDQLYGSTYRRITDTIAPSKPMLIGEIASSEFGGSKAAWISDMLARVPTYSKIRGLLWFERLDSNMDWPIETSASAASAFASGIQNPVYGANTFGTIATSPILPPG